MQVLAVTEQMNMQEPGLITGELDDDEGGGLVMKLHYTMLSSTAFGFCTQWCLHLFLAVSYSSVKNSSYAEIGSKWNRH